MIAVQSSRRDKLTQRAPHVAAITVATISLLVLLGWTLNIELLKSFLHPARVAMNPATAVAFLFSSAALWVLSRKGPIAPMLRHAGMLCATAALLIAAVQIGRLLGWWNFRVDTLLFASRLSGNVMAPNTAMVFLLINLAMLTLDARPWGRFHPSQPFLLIATAIAVLSLVGYLNNIASLYGVRGAIPMALNTAILFLTLAAGLICARPDREPIVTVFSPTLGGTVARRLIPSAFLVPIVAGWLLVVGWYHDWYDPAFAMTLFVLITIVVFNGLIWWNARVIQRTEVGRQRIAENLRLSEQRYHAIMQQTVEGIYLVDLDSLRIVETNSAMERMLGYEPGELEGQSVDALIDDVPERVHARMKALKETRQSFQGERRYRRKDGSVIDVYAGATVISYGERSAACTVLHDESERKRAVRLLQDKHDQLELAVAAERAALEQLRRTQSQLVQSEKLASLGQMVAGVAHEINNPLAFVSNNVAVLQRDAKGLCALLALYARADEAVARHDPELGEEIRDLAERMDLAYTQTNLDSMLVRSRDGLRRIQQIVKDLRDFARLDESDLHEVDLNSGIESTINIVAGRAKKKRVEIATSLAPLPLFACFPAKINQVIMNLVANAIDACPEGGRVTVTSRREGDAVRISVTDNGPGVPLEIRERIFDPFFTTKPQGEGTGLGLSISYGIINDHHGTIDVTDAPGGGAAFVITLPIRNVLPQSASAQRT